MCQKNVNTTNGLAIGLAVAIPIAVVALIICFFVYKAYRRNQREAQEETELELKGADLSPPPYPQGPVVAQQAFAPMQQHPPPVQYQGPYQGHYPAQHPVPSTAHLNDSTDSFGNPFDEKNPHVRSVAPQQHRHP